MAYIIYIHIHIPSTIIASSRSNFHRENVNDMKKKVPFDDRCLDERSSNRFRSIDEQDYSFLRWFRRCISSSHPIGFVFRGNGRGGSRPRWKGGNTNTNTHEQILTIPTSGMMKFCGVFEGFEIIIFLFLGNSIERRGHRKRVCLRKRVVSLEFVRDLCIDCKEEELFFFFSRRNCFYCIRENVT